MIVMYIHQLVSFFLERILSWLEIKSKKESISPLIIHIPLHEARNLHSRNQSKTINPSFCHSLRYSWYIKPPPRSTQNNL